MVSVNDGWNAFAFWNIPVRRKIRWRWSAIGLTRWILLLVGLSGWYISPSAVALSRYQRFFGISLDCLVLFFELACDQENADVGDYGGNTFEEKMDDFGRVRGDTLPNVLSCKPDFEKGSDDQR